MGDQPSAAESTSAKHGLTIRTSTTLTDEAFVLLRQSIGIFNMRRKQAEQTVASTLLWQERAASLSALLELHMPHRLTGENHPETLGSYGTLVLAPQHTARPALWMLESVSS